MSGIFKGFMGSGTSEETVKEEILNGAILVDVRSPEEFATETIDNAINPPVNRLIASNSGLTKEQIIIVFCKSGNRSSQAKHILEQKGFKRVINAGTWQDLKAVVDETRK